MELAAAGRHVVVVDLCNAHISARIYFTVRTLLLLYRRTGIVAFKTAPGRYHKPVTKYLALHRLDNMFSKYNSWSLLSFPFRCFCARVVSWWRSCSNALCSRRPQYCTDFRGILSS